jgi:hypothetical protein
MKSFPPKRIYLTIIRLIQREKKRKSGGFAAPSLPPLVCENVQINQKCTSMHISYLYYAINSSNIVVIYIIYKFFDKGCSVGCSRYSLLNNKSFYRRINLCKMCQRFYNLKIY